MIHPLPGVDLVVNTFERNYREVLAAGFFPRIEEENRHAFRQRIALINNVDDPAEVRARAETLVLNGEIDAWYEVAEHLPRALEATGLRVGDLGRIPHYTDCALVAVTLAGSPWLLYWDGDVRLESPTAWIEEAIQVMESEPRILVASPAWVPEPCPGQDSNPPIKLAEIDEHFGGAHLGEGSLPKKWPFQSGG